MSTPGGGLATASTALTALQGLGTAFGVVAAIGASEAKSRELEAKAANEQFLARDEFIEGQREQARLKKDLALTLQRQTVALAAGGVDLSSASAQEIQRQTIDDSERELGVVAGDTLRSRLVRNRNARNLRASARSGRTLGGLAAVPKIATFAAKAVNRG